MPGIHSVNPAFSITGFAVVGMRRIAKKPLEPCEGGALNPRHSAAEAPRHQGDICAGFTDSFWLPRSLPSTPTLPVLAQETPDSGEDISQVIVTGTRVANRSALDTAVPVDVVSADTLSNAGITRAESGTLRRPALASTFRGPGLADGTDTIRPATLRGLSPDQTLVLLNSKRRHPASLVNLNQTIGRGAAAVDLNTIPMAAVQTIEVLRDGASAQYGSDAIAGVINVTPARSARRRRIHGDLWSVRHELRHTASARCRPAPPGRRPSTIERSRSDGGTTTVSAWKGFGLGAAGYLTLAGEFKKQQLTRRDGYDFRQQYPLVNGAFDPREASFDRFDAWYGEPELKQCTAFLNAGVELGNGAKLYGWASYQSRDARSAGFFRRAIDDRNIICRSIRTATCRSSRPTSPTSAARAA